VSGMYVCNILIVKWLATNLKDTNSIVSDVKVANMAVVPGDLRSEGSQFNPQQTHCTTNIELLQTQNFEELS
jgi:hypothetical protein